MFNSGYTFTVIKAGKLKKKIEEGSLVFVVFSVEFSNCKHIFSALNIYFVNLKLPPCLRNVFRCLFWSIKFVRFSSLQKKQLAI